MLHYFRLFKYRLWLCFARNIVGCVCVRVCVRRVVRVGSGEEGDICSEMHLELNTVLIILCVFLSKFGILIELSP